MAIGQFMPMVVGGEVPFEYQLTDNAVFASSTSSPSFSSVSLGESSRKTVIVGFAARSTAARSVSAVTIGGVSAAKISGGSYYILNGWQTSEFWGANVEVSTGNILVSGSGTFVRGAVAVWSVRGLKSISPVDAAGGVTTSLSSSHTLLTADRGVVLATSFIGTDRNGVGQHRFSAASLNATGSTVSVSTYRDASSFTWTGADSLFDIPIANIATGGFTSIELVALR